MSVSVTLDTLEHAVRQVSTIKLLYHCTENQFILSAETIIILVECAQKRSQICNTVVATAVCHALRSTGMTVPQGCPSSDVIEA